ncbi:hypothetical protein GCM10009676_16170 [Prauserella halophila]|uniref:Uncharacterized protein n=1 Tax=Prauserella halophila TaxID=185641 RepID=A0ABN1W6I3_9PSEU|nr:hypothetical protein [Prauserella halophila]
MKIRYLGTSSEEGSCPTVYETDRDTFLVQGNVVTDTAALAELRRHNNGIPEWETVVEIPKELVRHFPQESRHV